MCSCILGANIRGHSILWWWRFWQLPRNKKFLAFVAEVWSGFSFWDLNCGHDASTTNENYARTDAKQHTMVETSPMSRFLEKDESFWFSLAWCILVMSFLDNRERCHETKPNHESIMLWTHHRLSALFVCHLDTGIEHQLLKEEERLDRFVILVGCPAIHILNYVYYRYQNAVCI